jgi:endo-1,3-1,4-beta-glycanase ExoK
VPDVIPARQRPAPAAALLLVLAAAGCAHTGSAPAESGPPVPEGGSFLEDFRPGRLDPARWTVSHGWSNGPWHGCTWSAENVKLADDGLQLLLTDQALKDRTFSCGELQSQAFLGYGVYEARLRAVPGAGVVTAFFAYTGPSHGRSHEEIDLEFLGKRPTDLQLNYFRNGKGGHEQMVPLGFDATAQVHDYAFVWTRDSVRWFVDGRQVHETRQAVPPAPARIYLSVWNGGALLGGWAGSFRYPGSPLVAVVERVAFTAEGTPCQFPGSLACRPAGGE